jgi:hypothetical protein
MLAIIRIVATTGIITYTITTGVVFVVLSTYAVVGADLTPGCELMIVDVTNSAVFIPNSFI